MTGYLGRLLPRLARQARREDGNATVEFVILFPIYLSLLAMSFELSIITLKETMLERGLDIAVREVRLGTGEFVQNYDTEQENDDAKEQYHNKLKKRICDEALIIPNCESSLKLEMIRSDMRNLTTLGSDADCTDKSEEGNATYHLVPGQANDLMFLRACIKVDPLFPTWELAQALKNKKPTNMDPNGQLAIVSMAAFVMEPL